ncbi:alpha/beta hydrolase [Saccharopolyspora sp. ID03-671]|uniref:alpha/beta hydrolase n=1 Tax=Saccharopolyspora sp. ID03-671 TaxID=3073066 RepID=UPI0032487467
MNDVVSYADVRRWKPEQLDAVHQQLGNRRDDLINLQDELDASRNPDGWTGDAAQRSADQHRELVQRMRSLVAEVATVRAAVATAADEVTAIKRRVEMADREAEGHGFQITEEGGVRDVKPPENVPADEAEQVRAQRIRVRDDLVDEIEKILDQAEATDAALAEALDAADEDEVRAGTGTTLASAASPEEMEELAKSAGKPAGTSPQAVADWWKSLSDEQRSAVLETNPKMVGNLDGIPATIRDKANRDRISDERGALRNRKAELSRKSELTDAEQAEFDGLDAKLKSLDKVEETLDKGDRQLLTLDSSGERMKAAVAVGDVDTADHVSVFTPGLTSTVDGSLGGYDNDMAKLVQNSKEQLSAEGKDESVAAVTWIGYEAPQIDGSIADVAGADRDSVISAQSAQEGGEKLNGFLGGINASRDEDPHLTAIGHSYGSTTTGYALQQGGHGVDDAVLYGSPGSGADSVKDLHLPEGHAYRMEAKWDPVADLGRFGDDLTHQDGYRDLSTEDSRYGEGVTGHSDYLNEDTTSQHNVAAVAAGLPDNIEHGSTSGVGDHISQGTKTVVDTGEKVVDGVGDGIGWTVDKAKDLF